MIRHIVWWTLKPEAEGRSAAENAELMKKAARGLIGKIPGLLSLDISGTVLGTSTMPACCTARMRMRKRCRPMPCIPCIWSAAD